MLTLSDVMRLNLKSRTCPALSLLLQEVEYLAIVEFHKRMGYLLMVPHHLHTQSIGVGLSHD